LMAGGEETCSAPSNEAPIGIDLGRGSSTDHWSSKHELRLKAAGPSGWEFGADEKKNRGYRVDRHGGRFRLGVPATDRRPEHRNLGVQLRLFRLRKFDPASYLYCGVWPGGRYPQKERSFTGTPRPCFGDPQAFSLRGRRAACWSSSATFEENRPTGTPGNPGDNPRLCPRHEACR